MCRKCLGIIIIIVDQFTLKIKQTCLGTVPTLVRMVYHKLVPIVPRTESRNVNLAITGGQSIKTERSAPVTSVI